MDYSSVSPYPPPVPPQPSTVVPDFELRLTRRQVRFLIDLALLGCIVAFLHLLWHVEQALRTPPARPAEPLAFEEIARRFARVDAGMSRDEVLPLLGAEQYRDDWEPEFDEFERLVQAHPDRYREPRYWAKWADPADPGRWVAVYIAGGYVQKTAKRGMSGP